MAVLFELAKEVNKSKDAGLSALLVKLANQIGLLEQNPESYFKAQPADSEFSEAQIEALIAERKTARANRDFARSDEIRDELLANSIELLDSAEGTTWRRN